MPTLFPPNARHSICYLLVTISLFLFLFEMTGCGSLNVRTLHRLPVTSVDEVALLFLGTNSDPLSSVEIDGRTTDDAGEPFAGSGRVVVQLDPGQHVVVLNAARCTRNGESLRIEKKLSVRPGTSYGMGISTRLLSTTVQGVVRRSMYSCDPYDWIRPTRNMCDYFKGIGSPEAAACYYVQMLQRKGLSGLKRNPRISSVARMHDDVPGTRQRWAVLSLSPVFPDTLRVLAMDGYGLSIDGLPVYEAEFIEVTPGKHHFVLSDNAFTHLLSFDARPGGLYQLSSKYSVFGLTELSDGGLDVPFELRRAFGIPQPQEEIGNVSPKHDDLPSTLSRLPAE